MYKILVISVLALSFVQGFAKITTHGDPSAIQVISEYEKRIQAIVDSLNIPDIRVRIINELKNITGESSAIDQCIEGQSINIDILATWIQETVESTCIQDAKYYVTNIKQELTQILDKYAAVSADIRALADKCLSENEGNEAEMTKCLQEQVKPKQEELLQIEIEIIRIMEDAKIGVKQSEVKLENCIYQINVQICTSEKEIIDFINKCVGTPSGYQSLENYYEKEVVFGIWDTIRNIIASIKDALGNIGGNISEIFKKLQEEIQEIINGLNLNEVIDKIIQKIKDVVGGVGGAVAACVDEQRAAIEELALESQAGSMACVQAAQEKILSIRVEVEQIVAKAAAIKEDAISRGLKCIKDNILHPTQVVPCFETQIGAIAQQIVQLKNDALALVQKAKDTAQEATMELGNCLAGVGESTNVKQSAIIEEIKKCISGQ